MTKSHEFWFDDMSYVSHINGGNWIYYDPYNYGFRNSNGDNCDQNNTRNNEIECVQIRGGAILTHVPATNTSGYGNITLSCLINNHDSNGLENDETFAIEYSVDNNMQNWFLLAEYYPDTMLNNGNNDHIFTIIQLPSIADDNPGVSVRFRNNGEGRTDRLLLDSVSLSGTWIQMDSTETPTLYPSLAPTLEPTKYPTILPTIITGLPSNNPTNYPTLVPILSIQPSSNKNIFPTSDPALPPTINPTTNPSTNPSKNPTVRPSIFTNINQPTGEPTRYPLITPTLSPLYYVTTDYPSLSPTHHPTGIETDDDAERLQDKNITLNITIAIISGVVIILLAIIIYQRVKEHLHLKELKLKEIASLSTMKNSNNSNEPGMLNEPEGTITSEGYSDTKRNTISSGESKIDGMSADERQFKYELNSIAQVSYYMNQNG